VATDTIAFGENVKLNVTVPPEVTFATTSQWVVAESPEFTGTLIAPPGFLLTVEEPTEEDEPARLILSLSPRGTLLLIR